MFLLGLQFCNPLFKIKCLFLRLISQILWLKICQIARPMIFILLRIVWWYSLNGDILKEIRLIFIWYYITLTDFPILSGNRKYNFMHMMYHCLVRNVEGVKMFICFIHTIQTFIFFFGKYCYLKWSIKLW